VTVVLLLVSDFFDPNFAFSCCFILPHIALLFAADSKESEKVGADSDKEQAVVGPSNGIQVSF
jgi:hypothetical protein